MFNKNDPPKEDNLTIILKGEEASSYFALRSKIDELISLARGIAHRLHETERKLDSIARGNN